MLISSEMVCCFAIFTILNIDTAQIKTQIVFCEGDLAKEWMSMGHSI